MPEETPIACSLDVGERGRRGTELAALGARALLDARRRDGRYVLWFRPEARDELERLVAAEGACCPFFELDVAERDGALVLTIGAPAEADELAQGLAEAFAGRRP